VTVSKGDRVRWTRRDETLTGTVAWEPFSGDDHATVRCDPEHEATVAGGVPISRIEHPRIDDLELIDR